MFFQPVNKLKHFFVTYFFGQIPNRAGGFGEKSLIVMLYYGITNPHQSRRNSRSVIEENKCFPEAGREKFRTLLHHSNEAALLPPTPINCGGIGLEWLCF